jgi:tRNA threonylcarbamoyladenosine biosynthesis protein TsaE
MPTRTVRNLQELEDFAGELLRSLPERKRATVLALSGELGAGKTAFVQALARRLGINEPVTSPTFIIMRRHAAQGERFRELAHIDAYRFEDPREAEVLGIPALFDAPQTLVCVEWPERMAPHMPKDAVRLSFAPQEDGSREIILYGDRT